jgi:hypothetical protein
MFQAPWGSAGEDPNMPDQRDQSVVDMHIRSAVAAAKRKGTTLKYSTFVARLRRRNAGIDIHSSYALDRLIRAAKVANVALEVDHADDD